MQCKYPVEIIGVDNESKDRTAEIFQACGVPYYTETQHSCGFARLCGLSHAKGKYHINIDSDTMYPPKYVELMVNALERPGIVAACSLWSYIPDETHPWLGLKVYETARDVHLWMQSFKRPELSVRGLVLLIVRNMQREQAFVLISFVEKTVIWRYSSSNSGKLPLSATAKHVP